MFYNFLALAEYHQGHFEEGASFAQKGIAIRPFHMLYRTLAACCGQLGPAVEAETAPNCISSCRRMPIDNGKLPTRTLILPTVRISSRECARQAGKDSRLRLVCLKLDDRLERGGNKGAGKAFGMS
jgi:hypothetical protein